MTDIVLSILMFAAIVFMLVSCFRMDRDAARRIKTIEEGTQELLEPERVREMLVAALQVDPKQIVLIGEG